MPTIFDLDQIRDALRQVDVTGAIERGFVEYSRRRVVVPPVGEMIFDEPPGDVHIKYGFIRDDDFWVIKVASAAYPADASTALSDGMMIVGRKSTSKLECFLLDECYLTNVRTAAAGAVAARYLAPKKVERIGVLGAGTQGRMQVEALLPIVDCRDVIVWGVDEAELEAYVKAMAPHGLSIATTTDADEVAGSCNLIVTATPSRKPLLRAAAIRPGTHITAMGSDTPEKIELEPRILADADVVVADSIEQSLLRGEIFQALEAGVLQREKVVELGNVIADPSLGRTGDGQTTVADLTGVAVQDIEISKAVYRVLTGRG
jgi:ornithine cyclodeaminase